MIGLPEVRTQKLVVLHTMEREISKEGDTKLTGILSNS